MWAEELMFYHIFPLGFCGAPTDNKPTAIYKPAIHKISEWIPHIKSLNLNAICLGPIFESSSHGYDTIDFRNIDRRLGANTDFKKVADDIHANGMRLIIEGVFSRVGREFWTFKNVRKNNKKSGYIDWFHITFGNESPYGDKFRYQHDSGHPDMPLLNLKNEHVKKHIFNAVKSWILDYDIDGIYLDKATELDYVFVWELRAFCKEIKSDFWILGDNDNLMNHECFKTLYTCFNDRNMFEIAYLINKQASAGKQLYTFLDNHETTRIANNVTNTKHLPLAYTLLMTMPCIPSIYYGSEWGVWGDSRDGERTLRKCLNLKKDTELTRHIKRLTRLRCASPALRHGDYNKVYLTNEQYIFMRRFENDMACVAINISDCEHTIKLNGAPFTMAPYSSQILVRGKWYPLPTA